jgi:hypothetical protein
MPDAAQDSPADAAIDAAPAVPVNQMNAGTVAENGTLSLANHLVTVDTDTLAASLTYTVRSLPADGALENDGTALAVGMTFTQDDVNNGKLTYEQNGAENASDSFDWDLSDGVNKIPATGVNTFEITVTPVNDAPVIVANPVSTVAEGAAKVLTDADLLVMDVEGTSALTYTLLGISRGQLQKDDGTGTFVALGTNGTFTQQNITDGQIRFVDPGTDDAMLAIQQSTSATFSWSVSDAEGGVNPATGSNLKTFTVTPVDDPPTVAFATSKCYVPGGATTRPANPLTTLSDPDNPLSAYQICVVSIGTGDSVVFSGTTTTIGTTITGIVPTLKSGTVTLSVGSCVAGNVLSGMTFASTATRSGGTIQYKLMKGTTQIGAAQNVRYLPTTPCP